MGLIVQGDLHFSETIYSKLPQMRGDAEWALRQLTDQALRGDHDLVLAGDYLDVRNPSAILLKKFFDILRPLTMAGHKVYIIQGQHDMGVIPFATITGDENIRWINQRVEGTQVGTIYGLDYQQRTVIDKAIKSIKKCDIAVIHQLAKEVCDHGPKNDINARSYDLSFADVPDSVDFVVAGDFHMSVDGTTNGRRWAYTGSATMRSFTEPRQKSFILIERDDKKNLTMRRIPLTIRPMIYVEAEYDHELSEKIAKIPDHVEELSHQATLHNLPEDVRAPFTVVRYASDISGAVGSVKDKLRSLINAGSLHFHYLAMARGNRSAIPEVEGGRHLSIDEAIDQCVDPEATPKLHKFVCEIADTRNPQDVVHSAKEQYGIDALFARI